MMQGYPYPPKPLNRSSAAYSVYAALIRIEALET